MEAADGRYWGDYYLRRTREREKWEEMESIKEERGLVGGGVGERGAFILNLLPQVCCLCGEFPPTGLF